MLIFKCIRCTKQLDVAYSPMGQTVDCPYCGNTNLVPGNNRLAELGVGTSARCPRLVYILVGIAVGFLGIHNFLAGYNSKATKQLLFTLCSVFILWPAIWIWAIIDVCNVREDADGVLM